MKAEESPSVTQSTYTYPPQFTAHPHYPLPLQGELLANSDDGEVTVATTQPCHPSPGVMFPA